MIKYEFKGDKYSKSKLCFEGKAIIINNNLNKINHIKYKCIDISKNLKIIFYNFNNKLKVNLEKEFKINFYDILAEFFKIFLLFLTYNTFIKKINYKKLFEYIFIIFSCSLIIIINIYTRQEFSFGYAPLQGGMDGIAHEGKARVMYQHFLNFDIYEMFRGGENVFWFMPGLRYFLTLGKVFFGDTQYGIYSILFLLTIFLYNFFKRFLTIKLSLILISVFIFIKLPHLGFSFDHYVRNSLTLYPEGLGVLMFFVGMWFMNKKNYLLMGLALALMVIIRPNYIPAFAIISLYFFVMLLKNHEWKNILLLIIGSSSIFIMPFHNFLYGEGAIVLFVSLNDTFSILPINQKIIYLSDYLSIFKSNEKIPKILNHLSNFLTTGMKNISVYFINSILLINILLYFFCNFYKKQSINLLFCYISIFQIIPSLFHTNVARYALFTWLLITLTNILIFKSYYIYFKKYKFDYEL